jgi:TolC family type I secretion outer membrane protein
MPSASFTLRSASAIMAFSVAALVAQPTCAETIADAIAYAYDVNPGLQAQRAAMRALDESYVQARSAYGPNVSASVGTTDYHERFIGTSPNGRISASTDSEALSLVQPLYTGGRVRSRVKTAEAQIKAGRETLRRYELDLLQRVVTAYVNVLRDQQLLQINQDTVLVLTKELAGTQAKFNVREVTMTDLAQSKARLSQALSQLANARAQLGISRAQYLGVVGQNPGSLAPPPALEDLPRTPDEAFTAAEANNPQLQSARYTEESTRAALAEAKAARLPSVSARVDLQRSPYVPYSATTFSNVTSAAITLSQPLFSSGQISSGIRRATEENNRDRLTIDDVRLQVLQQVSSTWEQLVALRQQLTTVQDEMKSDQVAFAGVRQEERFALRSTIEVLNAELELSNAQQNLARTRAAEYVSRVQLLAVTGALNVQMLAANVSTYDPAKNFRKIRNIGATPLELPVRALDAIASPRLKPEPPASLPSVRPTGSVLAPTPADANAPIVSIYSTIEQSPTVGAAAPGAAAPSPPPRTTPSVRK